MAMHATGRSRVVTAASVHPEYRQMLATYLANLGVELVDARHARRSRLPPPNWPPRSTTETACVLVQHPNFFGCLEEVEQLAEIAHQAGALFVVVGRSDQPGPAEAAGRLRGRHRRGRGAIAGQPDGLRRAVPGHHGLPRAVRPPHARPAGRPDGRSPRQPLLGADAANPRAAHPPRKGHQQHLHQPRAVCPAGRGLPVADGPGRHARAWPSCVCKRPTTPPSGWRPCRRCRWRSIGRRSRSLSSA